MRIGSQNMWNMPHPGRDTPQQSIVETAGPTHAQTSAAAPPPPPPQGNGGQSEDRPQEESLLDRILARGFSQFVADIEAQKLKELREKLLGAMGLTEADLEKMSPDQRQAIEDSIAEEIKRRLEAAAIVNGGNTEGQDQTALFAMGLSVSGAKSDTASSGNDQGAARGLNDRAEGIGLGPLLALQEVEDGEAKPSRAVSDANADKPGKNDPIVI